MKAESSNLDYRICYYVYIILRRGKTWYCCAGTAQTFLVIELNTKQFKYYTVGSSAVYFLLTTSKTARKLTLKNPHHKSTVYIGSWFCFNCLILFLQIFCFLLLF